MRNVLVSLVFLLGSLPAEAKSLKIASAEAKSSEPDKDGATYQPKNVSDSKKSSAWIEGESGSGLGSWIQIQLDGTQTVTGIRLWNGVWFTYDFWQRHNRAKEIEIELSDGTTKTVTLKDEMVPEEIRFDKPVQISSVKLTIRSIYGGSTFNDTGLSEIQVFDDTPEETVAVARFSASSVYPEDGDGSYEPLKMQDGLLDTMWCENNKDGDGSGEWVEFDFGGNHTVSSLIVNNGNAYDFKYNMKANRAKTATLTFSDGSSQQITLKPAPLTQTISFSEKNTSKVRMTFNEIMKGTEFNDLCISEAYFK